MVRARTQNGAKMVELMVEILNGESIAGKRPKLRDRMDAATWLSDRGFGRPVQAIEHSGSAPPVTILFNSSLNPEKLR